MLSIDPGFIPIRPDIIPLTIFILFLANLDLGRIELIDEMTLRDGWWTTAVRDESVGCVDARFVG